jgi:8-oxo-dGTP pyrophosphatase MutT (NUDIX family)
MNDRTQKLRQKLSPLSRAPVQRSAESLSSVLLLLVKERTSQEAHILLTKRTMLVENHKGEISFPGGYWEATDASLVDTALREANEEIGSDSKDIQLLGALSSVTTHQGVKILPVVGSLDTPYAFQPNPAEVERLLYLPLTQLLDEGIAPVEVRVGDLLVPSEGIYLGVELVWGATAKILRELRELLL